MKLRVLKIISSLMRGRRKLAKVKFDARVLKKNDISILSLDERWNNLFINTEKTEDILKCEVKLRELLKQEARLTSEAREIPVKKKKCMDRIIKLTTEAFDNNNEAARQEMQACEKEILRINERIKEIEPELDRIADSKKAANLELLEHTVNVVYLGMRARQKKVAELDRTIEEMRDKLKKHIDERAALTEDFTGTYSYFHDLIGGEELEKLDKKFFDD